MKGCRTDLQGAIERYDPEHYAAAASLMDNVLFGRIGNQQPDGPERIRAIVRDLLDELGLYDDVLDVGLDFNVGAGGRRLTGGAAPEARRRARADQARRLHDLQPAAERHRPARAGPDPAQRARGGKARRPQAGDHLGAVEPGNVAVSSTA